jgi:hypothetical protein
LLVFSSPLVHLSPLWCSSSSTYQCLFIFSLHWLTSSYVGALTCLLHLGIHCLCVIISLYVFLLVIVFCLFCKFFLPWKILHLCCIWLKRSCPTMFFLFATFRWSNASLFCYIVLQYIGCFLCFFLYFLFSLCCWVGVVNICILFSLLSIIRRSWSSYSPILESSCFFLLYFVEMCICYGVLVCCTSLKCAFLAMVFFFVECIIVLLLCDAIHLIMMQWLF